MQWIILQNVDVFGPFLGRDPLWFDSLKRPLPASGLRTFAFWVVAYGSFDLIIKQYINIRSN